MVNRQLGAVQAAPIEGAWGIPVAWFSAFSKQEPSDLAPVLRDREQIIAYLEALFRQGSELLAHLPGDNLEPYSVRLEQISEA